MSLINVPNIFCNTKCLKNKEMKELYDNYQDVKLQLQNEVDNSKNYYSLAPTNKFDTSAALLTNSKKIKIANTFNTSIDTIESQIEMYKTNYAGLNNDLELYSLYYSKNNNVMADFDDKKTITLTNDRNSYYENESSTSKTYYNSLLKYAYILTLILFVLFLYLVKTVLTSTAIILLLILFIIYPFIFYNIFKSLHSYFLN
jgi:hypothetical protein